MKRKIGFGGGCHWCTEAVFQSVKGVEVVDQGWIKSKPPQDNWSEAVIVHFDDSEIPLQILIEIHMLTHSSSSMHGLREKYRSAIYPFSNAQKHYCARIINQLQLEENEKYITQVLPYVDFKLNQEEFLNYFATRKDAPFCETYIRPKLRMLLKKYGPLIKDVS